MSGRTDERVGPRRSRRCPPRSPARARATARSGPGAGATTARPAPRSRHRQRRRSRGRLPGVGPTRDGRGGVGLRGVARRALAVEPEAQREQPDPQEELHDRGGPCVERVAEPVEERARAEQHDDPDSEIEPRHRAEVHEHASRAQPSGREQEPHGDEERAEARGVDERQHDEHAGHRGQAEARTADGVEVEREVHAPSVPPDARGVVRRTTDPRARKRAPVARASAPCRGRDGASYTVRTIRRRACCAGMEA